MPMASYSSFATSDESFPILSVFVREKLEAVGASQSLAAERGSLSRDGPVAKLPNQHKLIFF